MTDQWLERVEVEGLGWPNVAVYCRFSRLRAACAEACLHPVEVPDLPDAKAIWWINRVLVPEERRGEGIGRELLRRLKSLVAQQGCDALIVVPGGYDVPHETQVAFYAACGFKAVNPEGLMLWLPQEVTDGRAS